MPVYVYECKPNAHRFEVRQGVNDPRVATCPECGGEVRRVILPVGIVFKGSGFYATDSRSSNSAVKPADSSSSAGKVDGEGSSGDKSESTKDSGANKSGSESKPAGDSGGSSSKESSGKSETPAAS